MLSILLFIDSGFCHSMPVAAFTAPSDIAAIEQALAARLIREVTPTPGHCVRNCARYVLTSGGSHHVGTFRLASLDA